MKVHYASIGVENLLNRQHSLTQWFLDFPKNYAHPPPSGHKHPHTTQTWTVDDYNLKLLKRRDTKGLNYVGLYFSLNYIMREIVLFVAISFGDSLIALAITVSLSSTHYSLPWQWHSARVDTSLINLITSTEITWKVAHLITWQHAFIDPPLTHCLQSIFLPTNTIRLSGYFSLMQTMNAPSSFNTAQ